MTLITTAYLICTIGIIGTPVARIWDALVNCATFATITAGRVLLQSKTFLHFVVEAINTDVLVTVDAFSRSVVVGVLLLPPRDAVAGRLGNHQDRSCSCRRASFSQIVAQLHEVASPCATRYSLATVSKNTLDAQLIETVKRCVSE